MGVRMRVARIEKNELLLLDFLPSFVSLCSLASNLGTNDNPTANKKATAAVLNTSLNNTARKEDHTPLFETGAR